VQRKVFAMRSAGLKTLHPDWPNTNAAGFVTSVYADQQ
jgi:hypothetical protein